MLKNVLKFLNAVNYWSVVIVPFAAIIGLGLANAFAIVMAVSFFMMRLIDKEKISVMTPVMLAYSILVLSVLLSMKNTVHPDASVKGLIRWGIEYPFFFLVIANSVKDAKHIKFIIISIAVSISIVSIDALWQLVTGKDLIWGKALFDCPIALPRVSASFNGPNLLGIYLSMLTPVIGGVALFYQKGRFRVLTLCAFILGILATALTLSRGSGLGVWFALLLLAIIRKSKILSIVLILILLISPFIMPRDIKNWAQEMKYNPAVFLFNKDRLSMYRNAINMIKNHPVIGVGTNTFSRNYSRYRLPESEDEKTADTTYAHNIYLHTAGEIGLLGLAAFILFIFSLFKQGINYYLKSEDAYLRIVSISFLAGLAAFLVNGVTETSLYYPTVVIIFWFLVGLSLSLKRFTV